MAAHFSKAFLQKHFSLKISLEELLQEIKI